MKFVGIVGSNAQQSYNRELLKFIQKHYTDILELELLEIHDVPLFNQDNDQTHTPVIQNLAKKIENADGVIISTPEHNHTVPAALKSILEWLSFKIHPLEHKPVMVIGASYLDQGTSRAQLHLRQILDAPGVNAYVFPGNEFLLGKVKEAFDEQGNIKDQNTINYLQMCLEKFVKYVKLVAQIDDVPSKRLPDEDLHATGKAPTTIEGVDMSADDWVDQAAAKVNAVEGDTYVRLDHGILTVDQLNYFLKSLPQELTFADENNQFIYYNYNTPTDEMLAKRKPEQVGNPLANCHPERVHKGVKWVISQLRSGQQDIVKVHVPFHGPDKFVVHSYQAMHDEEGNYRGINEYIQDIKPIVDYYLEQTGQKLVADENVDATAGASQNDGHSATTDATAGASEATSAPEEVPATDATTGASEH